MATKAEMRRKIRRLEKKVLKLMIEANDARASAGEWYQAAQDADAALILAHWPSAERVAAMKKPLDG